MRPHIAIDRSWSTNTHEFEHGLMEPVVVEIRNPAGIDIPEMESLFVRGFSKDELLDVDGAVDWVRHATSNPDCGVFVAREGYEWVGIMVIDKSQEGDAFSNSAWIPMVYSEGSMPVLKSLMRCVREWMIENGVERVRGLNRTGRSDKAHIRMFGKGFSAEVLGSVIEYRMEGDSR